MPQRFLDNTFEQVIGEFDPDFFDSQEQIPRGTHSSSEELPEDDFYEGQYAHDETRTLEELIWPPEMLFNHCHSERTREHR